MCVCAVVCGVMVSGALLPAPGPRVTVFIGNIAARAPDGMVRALLAACGPLVAWKRAGSFGFAEFGGVEAALRCVRLLHQRPLADRQLVAKTDGKMQALVDAYEGNYRTSHNYLLGRVGSIPAEWNSISLSRRAYNRANSWHRFAAKFKLP